MVQTCVAYNCGRRHKKGDPPSFHRFPKNGMKQQRWIAAGRFQKYEPSKNDRICSYFLETEYKSSGRWGNDAVPSIFKFFGHLLQSTASSLWPVLTLKRIVRVISWIWFALNNCIGISRHIFWRYLTSPCTMQLQWSRSTSWSQSLDVTVKKKAKMGDRLVK